ncbi:MAG TPA: hypothetical protein VGO93_16550, partial [Candidatus Xenobia bacterium]
MGRRRGSDIPYSQRHDGLFKGQYNLVTNKWKLMSQSGSSAPTGGATFVTITGVQDGTNVTFTIPAAPSSAGSQQFFR